MGQDNDNAPMVKRDAHARIFDCGKYGTGLAFIDHDEAGSLCLRFRLWLEAVDGPGELTVKLPAGASDNARDLWDAAQAMAITDMTTESFLAVCGHSGLLAMFNEQENGDA